MSRRRCLIIFMRTENRTLLRVKLTLYEEPQVTTVCVRNEFVEIGSGKVSKQRATAHIHCSERRCEATHEASREFSRSEPELRSVDERVRVRVSRRPSKIRFGAVSMDSDCVPVDAEESNKDEKSKSAGVCLEGPQVHPKPRPGAKVNGLEPKGYGSKLIS